MSDLAIDHHQDGPLGGKPAFDEIGQQRLASRCVFGGAIRIGQAAMRASEALTEPGGVN